MAGNPLCEGLCYPKCTRALLKKCTELRLSWRKDLKSQRELKQK